MRARDEEEAAAAAAEEEELEAQSLFSGGFCLALRLFTLLRRRN